MLLWCQKWIRMRARQGGIPRPVSVELVSALKGWGVEELLVRLHREVGSTGDVWVVRRPVPIKWTALHFLSAILLKPFMNMPKHESVQLFR